MLPSEIWQLQKTRTNSNQCQVPRFQLPISSCGQSDPFDKFSKQAIKARAFPCHLPYKQIFLVPERSFSVIKH